MAIINEILDSITGKQPNSNLAKASVTINVGTYIEKTKENKTVMEQTIVKPIVEIQKHGEYIVCDLQFISAYDADLREMYNLIEMYGNNINGSVLEDYPVGEARIPTFVLMLTAINGIDNCITLASPIFWALTSNKPGATPSMIRLLFVADDVMFYEGTVEINQDEIEKEVKEQRLRTEMDANFYSKREEELKKNNS